MFSLSAGVLVLPNYYLKIKLQLSEKSFTYAVSECKLQGSFIQVNSILDSESLGNIIKTAVCIIYVGTRVLNICIIFWIFFYRYVCIIYSICYPTQDVVIMCEEQHCTEMFQCTTDFFPNKKTRHASLPPFKF